MIFVGNFLRINTIAMKSLANAMEFWSGGAMKVTDWVGSDIRPDTRSFSITGRIPDISNLWYRCIYR